MKKGSFFLLLTSLIWGMAFVAQSSVSVGPWVLNLIRAILAAALLSILISVLRRFAGLSRGINQRNTRIGAISSGVFLACASMLQQSGIMRTTVGKASFITTLYVIFVPLIGLFFHRRASAKIWFCVALAAAGLYFLCMKGSLAIGPGDFMVLISAILYAGQMFCISLFSEGTESLEFSRIQFLTMAVCCLPGALIFDGISLPDIQKSAIPLLYVGIMSSGIGGTLQVIGQRDTDPTVASLLLSLESVFAAVGGFVILGQVLTPREIFGCALTFSAVVIAQVPIEKLIKRRPPQRQTEGQRES